jgi:hypothetical protein
VISALGGITKVAALTDSTPKAVSGWQTTRGCFPTRTHAVMTAALRKRGLMARWALWGMTNSPRQRVRRRKATLAGSGDAALA